MPFFSKVFRTKDRDATFPKSKKHALANGVAPLPPPKPHWDDAWQRKEVEPEEVQELLRGCVHEVKSRALDMPFLLLPFRPASDPVAARSFIRNYFNADRPYQLHGDRLSQELLLTEPTVLCGVMKWCWSRLPGGVVTWEAYELFRVGEQDSNTARDAFATFIPISADSVARTKIIFDFFDLMAAIAAHGKTNGMGGRKLSRLAGWWAFGHHDTANGFEGGYQSWSRAADAASHLFFAYLRSLSPDSIRGTNGISALPLSLQTLVQATDYPPPTPTLAPTAKVVMIVDSVSPTPFALLRRAKHFEYREDDRALQEFSSYDDPTQALTDECQRVLRSISSTNESAAITAKDSQGLPDASWSRFEDLGFRGFGDYSDEDDEKDGFVLMKKRKDPPGLRSTPLSKSHDLGRPTTPSWADFLSSGFIDDAGDGGPAPLLLPHDKILPPLGERGQSSQSHRRKTDDADLIPGELASITTIYLDDAFWWVWISSLAGEETTDRKAVFGRCALVETNISGGKWLVLEEIVKGAAPEPEEGAYIAEKKTRFGFSTRGRFGRTKSGGKKQSQLSSSTKLDPYARNNHAAPASKVSIGPDQHARIQAAAAALQEKQKRQEQDAAGSRRARTDDPMDTKTNSVFTLQPVIMNEAAPAMKWASSYDKEAIRATYLGDNFAGRGSTGDLRGFGVNGYMNRANESATQLLRTTPIQVKVGLTNGFHRDDSGLAGRDSAKDRNLPALPSATPQDRVPAAPLEVPPPTSRLPISNEAAIQAAEVPLPTPTPMEGHHRPSASPDTLPPKQNFDDFDEGLLNGSGPASGQENLNGGRLSEPSSPEGKGGARKLSKPQPGAGLKGFFGKRKPGAPTLPAPLGPVDSNAVAAARAAYVGPSMKPNYTAGPSNLSRRISLVGRKRVPANTLPSGASLGSSAPSAPLAPPAEKAGGPEIQAPIPITAKRFEPVSKLGMSSRSSLVVNTVEPRQEERVVHRFNQGPMLDQPAFVPEDSPERQPSSPVSVVAPPPPLENHPANRKRSSEEEVRSPESNPEAASREEASREAANREEARSAEVSESEEEESESPPLDRWAQIRKNAAERAARQNNGAKPVPGMYVEERSRGSNLPRSDDEDADGETSGEETIESRVARIKARVAELTGKIEPTSTST